jgi:hypothetical protein
VTVPCPSIDSPVSVVKTALKDPEVANRFPDRTVPNDELTAPSMIRVPGGTVDLRDDRRNIRWRAEIAPFLLGEFPVTMKLHRAVRDGISIPPRVPRRR